jgi:hypothetical protein
MNKLGRSKLNLEISFINMRKNLKQREKMELNIARYKCNVISKEKLLQHCRRELNSFKNKKLSCKIKTIKLSRCKRKWLLLMSCNL